jgi:hypothetical protein
MPIATNKDINDYFNYHVLKSEEFTKLLESDPVLERCVQKLNK